MKQGMRFLCLIICISILSITVFAESDVAVNARSYILMDSQTGTVMLENNADEKLPIASVTKVMTMLLTMEALQSGKITLDDTVTCSEYASTMGGSQIYLKAGEQMPLRDILKSVAVASANDAACALAEHIMGTESAFVDAMNSRAKTLGMNNTHFVNCNGLDEDNHYSSARDVAIMSRELLKHKEIIDYTSIWMDTVRNGEFGLSNTNKLIRFYPGAIGVKTGSTSTAKYCLSAAATREGLTLVAVVIAAETTQDRFEGAKSLLNYGFANYTTETPVVSGEKSGEVSIVKGVEDTVDLVAKNDFSLLISKNEKGMAEKEVVLYNEVKAPVAKEQKLGEIIITLEGEEKGRVDLVADRSVEKLTVGKNLGRLIRKWTVR